jgi:hypothetical protein
MRTLGFTDAEIAELWRKAPKNKHQLDEPCVLIDPGPSKERTNQTGSRLSVTSTRTYARVRT